MVLSRDCFQNCLRGSIYSLQNTKQNRFETIKMAADVEYEKTREGPPPKKQEAVEEQLEADEKLEIDEVFAAEEEEKEKVTDKKKNPVEQEDIDPQYGLTDRGHPVVQETGNRDEESDDVEERV
ncbi:uncharacterized protein LOC116619844 isoform X3 [Nematostella vectensis]|uniref:uncharacterized protein LOC116619844 isoform X3 n=1 Tax=Nematostella vectensis TaxID=45351 RepID=UPI0020777A70|nr:uncharacterized protein LOC116619844 isoform X3 [Nematostella vectensis]